MTLPALLMLAFAIDFTIELDSTGGFSGRGAGAITISSEGWARASSIGAQRRSGPQTSLTRAEIDALQRAVAAAISKPWPASVDPANDSGCCDRYKWTLRLKRSSATEPILITSWHDVNARYLPAELAALHELTAAILTRALKEKREER